MPKSLAIDYTALADAELVDLARRGRREAYRQMAERLGDVARAAYDRTFAQEPAATS